MKRLFRMFELSNNEQRVVLIVILTLVAIAFIGYERRIHRAPLGPTSATKAELSPTPAEDVQTKSTR
jgi:hypothetical protein